MGEVFEGGGEMKVWITKYALSAGIQEREAEVNVDSKGMIGVAPPNRPGFYTEYFYKPDWHTSKEEAHRRAEIMRLKKIVSLKNQIAKLEKLGF
jgi:hypothetical protein